MEDRDGRHRFEVVRTSGVSRAVLLAGTLPAVVYGAAIAELTGALVAVALWLVVGAVAIQIRRSVARSRPSPPVVEESGGQELFDQLILEPCDRCGTETLLGTCLDCAATQQPNHHHRWDEAPGDEPEDRGA